MFSVPRAVSKGKGQPELALERRTELGLLVIRVQQIAQLLVTGHGAQRGIALRPADQFHVLRREYEASSLHFADGGQERGFVDFEIAQVRVGFHPGSDCSRDSNGVTVIGILFRLRLVPFRARPANQP